MKPLSSDSKTLFTTLNRALQIRLTQVFLIALIIFGLLQWQVWERHRQDSEKALTTSIQSRLAAIAQSGALLMDPDMHGEIFDYHDYRLPGFQALKERLTALTQANQLKEEIYTLRLEDPQTRQASFVIMSGLDPQTDLP